MNANDLTHHLIAELQRVAAANCETRCVLDAMSPHITDAVLSATVDQMSAIAAEEASIAEWLLDGQGQAPEGCAARPVEPVANAGWSATEQLDPQLRDIEIGTVATQLQSYHLASWFGIAATKARFTLSPGQGCAATGLVVITFLPRTTPFNPVVRINRSTVQRAMSRPSRRRACQTLRVP